MNLIVMYHSIACRRAAEPLKVSLENTSALHLFLSMNHFVCITNSQTQLPEGNRANPANLALGRLS